jgi:hypothetical protein
MSRTTGQGEHACIRCMLSCHPAVTILLPPSWLIDCVPVRSLHTHNMLYSCQLVGQTHVYTITSMWGISPTCR